MNLFESVSMTRKLELFNTIIVFQCSLAKSVNLIPEVGLKSNYVMVPFVIVPPIIIIQFNVYLFDVIKVAVIKIFPSYAYTCSV